jgi:hypothetical protein
MKNKFCLFIILVCLFQAMSCKKDSQTAQQVIVPQPQQSHTLETGLVDFSITGELLAAAIDTTLNTIAVIIPDSLNEQKLTAAFTLASEVNAAINNTIVNNSVVYDFSKPVVLTLTSTDKKRSTSFTITVQTELQYFGLTGKVTAAKSLNKNYEFYSDQFDGSPFASINCGPTVSTMAMKWADANFTKTPVEARDEIKQSGGWWSTADIQSYLEEDDIDNTIDTLSNVDSLIRKNIDNNNIVILCLDMYYVPFNGNLNQHIQKFYQTFASSWGHFLLVKGYKQLDNQTFYLEIYDPYSDGAHYTGIASNQLKGKDRYYLSSGIKTATKIWWPYAIIAAPKGQKVIASTELQLNSAGKPKPVPVAYGR